MTQILFQLLTHSVIRGEVTGCLRASVSTNYKMGQVSLAHSQVTEHGHCVRQLQGLPFTSFPCDWCPLQLCSAQHRQSEEAALM